MTRIEKQVNLGAVVLPFAATLAAIVLFWNSAVSATDLAILAVMYVLTGLGVTVGFHRLLTHRSFQVAKPVEYTFAVLGSMAVQGPVINWVADHRKHHAHADEEGDPHSPHVGHGDGPSGGVCGGSGTPTSAGCSSIRARRGRQVRPRPRRGPRNAPHQPALPGAGAAQPARSRRSPGGRSPARSPGAATGLLWGGLVRIFLVHHVTWSVNSVCHFLGNRRFETDDQSTNVFWLALPSFGESWHHNHHAFPRSAAHGLRRWELDPSALVITALEKLGVARNVVRISPERQDERERGAAPQRRAAPVESGVS